MKYSLDLGGQQRPQHPAALLCRLQFLPSLSMFIHVEGLGMSITQRHVWRESYRTTNF
jgi:hypothetical protein